MMKSDEIAKIQPKNICFVIPTLAGGGQKVVISLATELLKLGHFVNIIIFENKIAYSVKSGINLHIFYDKPNFKNAKNFKKQFQQLNIKQQKSLGNIIFKPNRQK
ncbi:MAG: glycosyltransferase, partial [Candidatus Thioglobus sp.]|nr:glycosyltransferase [Candidatus Thioglobus sp.]